MEELLLTTVTKNVNPWLGFVIKSKAVLSRSVILQNLIKLWRDSSSNYTYLLYVFYEQIFTS